jgi:hypothetical protein
MKTKSTTCFPTSSPFLTRCTPKADNRRSYVDYFDLIYHNKRFKVSIKSATDKYSDVDLLEIHRRFGMLTNVKRTFGTIILIAAVLCCLPGCATAGWFGSGSSDERLPRDAGSYFSSGKSWGELLWKEGRQPGSINDKFTIDLVNNIDYFSVHSDLKEAFKKGFRTGYADRVADLVLGPHLTAAAAYIGRDTSGKFVKVITTFEVGWAETLKHAVDVFIILISEGSQADRENFIENFRKIYTQKYNSTQTILKGRQKMSIVSQGGTMLYIDYSKGKALGALDIPSPDSLKTEIYNQTFMVMGDEWGKRLSNNLIKRPELVDLLRRCKTALQEVPAPARESNISMNLATIQKAFIDSYGTDAGNVFNGLLQEAGYSAAPTVAPGVGHARAKQKK